MLPHADKVNDEQREGKQAVPCKTITAIQNRMGNHQRPAKSDKDGLIDSGILESQFDGYSLTGSASVFISRILLTFSTATLQHPKAAAGSSHIRRNWWEQM